MGIQVSFRYHAMHLSGFPICKQMGNGLEKPFWVRDPGIPNLCHLAWDPMRKVRAKQPKLHRGPRTANQSQSKNKISETVNGAETSAQE